MAVLYVVGSAVVMLVWLIAGTVIPRIPGRKGFLCLAAGLSLSLYLPAAQLLKFYSLRFYADFSHWVQLIHRIAFYGKPWCQNQDAFIPGTLNYLSVHFTPAVFLFSALFKIIPRPELLIIINSALMLSSAVPLYLLARKLFPGSPLFPLLPVFLLFLNPTFQYIVLYEFEVLRFSIPLLFWMLYAWESDERALFWAAAILALLIREEVGLAVMSFGFYAFVFTKKKREGMAVALTGLAALLLITFAVMPSMRSENYTHVASGSFSHLSHPLTAVKAVFSPVKAINLMMLLLPLGFVPLAEPSILLAASANVGLLLLSNSETHLSYMLYYVSPAIPFIFYAFLYAYRRLSANAGQGGFPGRRFNLSAACVAGCLTANFFFGPSPVSLQFWLKGIRPAPFRTQNFHYTAYRPDRGFWQAQKLAQTIPEHSVVSAPQSLMPILYAKQCTVLFPRITGANGSYPADFVMFDSENHGLRADSPAYVDPGNFERIRSDRNWKLIGKEGRFELFEKVGS